MSYDNPFPYPPSASMLYRIMECPASHKASMMAPDVKEDLSDASLGQDVHGVLSDDLSADEVSADAAQTAEMCQRDADKLLAEWQVEGSIPDGLKELRYALVDIGHKIHVVTARKDLLGDVLFSGQFDLLYTQSRKCESCKGSGSVKFGDKDIQCPKCNGAGKLNYGLLIDFKALHGKHPSAIENPQLMSLAVLVAKKHGLESVRVALVQPWKGKPTVADFGADGLALAESLLLQVLADERNAAPEDRKAGEHCKYCKARFTCQTLRDKTIQDLDMIRPETIGGDAKHQAAVIFARMAELSIPQLIHIQENVRQIMSVFLASHAAAFKQAVENGEVPGYALKEKSGRRKVSDVGVAFARAAVHGVTAEAFTGKCSISLKALNEVVKDATKKKGKSLEYLTDEILQGITDTGEATFEVVKIGSLE